MESQLVNLVILLSTLLPIANPVETPAVVVVVGAGGSREYSQRFQQWAEQWKLAAAQGGASCHRVGEDTDTNRADRERLQEVLRARTAQSTAPLWVVLIGHGTFDGRNAKFNLRGPDVTAAELDSWLRPIERPQIVINCTSSSAPFINRLSGANRIVITATKSGFELNYARFGSYLCAAITDPDADLDKDGQTSLLEAFLFASARVSEFYAQEARLQTETALIDDNGDGRGTPAAWFRGIHTIRQPRDDAAEPDGARAHQIHLVPSSQENEMPPELRAERDEIELQITRLRQAKSEMSDDAYYAALERLLIRMARIYERVEQPRTSSD
jgi:hypothetical protein